MKAFRARIWLLPILTLTLVYLAGHACAQDSGASAAAPQDQPQVAQPPDGGVNWKGVGVGAGAVVSNLVYVPAKLVYGILGGIAGGAGYALTGGNKQVADSIWRSSLGGDYVLTPDMMTGKKPIYFSGPSEAASVPAANRASVVSPSTGTPPTGGVSSSTPATGSDSLPATHPIDNGAGLVGTSASPGPVPYAGANNPDYHNGASSQSPAPKRSSLSDTSVE
jgi:hypothetical protein